MRKTVKKVIKDMATGLDGESYDIGRILMAIGFFSMVGFQGVSVFKTGTFDPQNFGIGLGGLLGGGCAGLGFKSRTEPTTPPEEQP